MVGEVTVIIVKVSSQVEPPASWLEYEVWNEAHVPIWLVDDDWLIWRQTATRIELSYIRGRLRPGAQVFGYFPPSVIKVEPGDHVSKVIQLSWPYTLDQLWNTERFAAPPPGEYQVSVRVGYGLTDEPDAPNAGEGVEASVLRWQREAVSQAVQMEVPPYRLTDGRRA